VSGPFLVCAGCGAPTILTKPVCDVCLALVNSNDPIVTMSEHSGEPVNQPPAASAAEKLSGVESDAATEEKWRWIPWIRPVTTGR
jgi:hypothetical protein